MKKVFFLTLAILLLSAGMVLADEAAEPDPMARVAPDGMRPILKGDSPGENASSVEDFELCVPPIGWDLNVTDTTNPMYTWFHESFGFSGDHSAAVMWDSHYSMEQNESLITLPLDLAASPNMSISFWWMMSYKWGVSPYDNYDFNVKVSEDGGATWTHMWNEHDFGLFLNWTWYKTELDLSSFSGSANVIVAFNYKGYDGAALYLDNVEPHRNSAEIEMAGHPVIDPVCETCSDPRQDNFFDAGEEGAVTLQATNTGAGIATNVRAIVKPLSDNARVVEKFFYFPDIPKGETRTCIRQPIVKAHFSAECGEILTWGILFIADQGAWTDTFSFVVGDPGHPVPFENFESGPPAGWTVIDNLGNGHVWDTNLFWNRPNYAGGQGVCAAADSDHAYAPMDTELWTPPFDLKEAPGAMLNFTASFYALSDWFNVDISVNGGISWTNLAHWDTNHSSNGPGSKICIDLTPYAGHSDCIIRFHYYAPGWNYWVQLDNIYICKTVGSVVKLLDEHFESPDTFPPPGWSVNDLAGTGNIWSRNDMIGMPNFTCGTGEAATANSYYFGPDLDTELYSPPIDMEPTTSGLWEACLSFEADFYLFGVSSQALLDVTNDGGATWNNLMSWDTDHKRTSEVIDLTPYVGDTIQLRWRYINNNDWAAGWLNIDDVVIKMGECYCEMTPCMDMECFAQASDDVAQTGDTVSFNSFADTNCPTGDIIYRWEFGDGKETTGQSTNYTYKEPGVYEWKLTVRANDCGLVSEKAGVITVDNPFDLFVYDNDGQANLFLNTESGRCRFEIFDGMHRGVTNGFGAFGDCRFPEKENETAEFLCFYSLDGDPWVFQFCFDMTHKIYHGTIVITNGNGVQSYTIYDDSNYTE